MGATSRLGLPLLASGQAQKELFHNESLQILDVLVGAAVDEPPRSQPPAAPTPGACYIVAASPSGEWADRAHRIAAFTTAGWRYLDPREGMTALIRSTGQTAFYRSGAWQLGVVECARVDVGGTTVVRSRRPAISNPVGGDSIDDEGRAAIVAILSALRAHGLIEV